VTISDSKGQKVTFTVTTLGSGSITVQ
jgi:hypothetical protein